MAVGGRSRIVRGQGPKTFNDEEVINFSQKLMEIFSTFEIFTVFVKIAQKSESLQNNTIVRVRMWTQTVRNSEDFNIFLCHVYISGFDEIFSLPLAGASEKLKSNHDLLH